MPRGKKVDTKIAYPIIKKYEKTFSIVKVCEFVKVSRSGYCDWRKKKISSNEKKLLDMILECEKEHKNCYGYRRVTMWIRRKHGMRINHKCVYRIMQKDGIKSVIRRKRYKKPACNGNLRYDNILNRNFVSQKPNEKWVTDITYIQTEEGTCYLSVIRDLCGGIYCRISI